GTSGRLFGALGEKHIKISMIAQGSDENNNNVCVKEEDLKNNIKVIYDTFVTKKGE
ncbi:ACT domain-containing protein, partial [Absicoccus porci]|uniref:ACT domain-containing protein n=1 Tax=Absicoccus porci TaxID=2486576 RepID=UPI003C6C6C10